ncbi:MAG: RNA polymerase sporulation sigma factor SigH [Oscillospiraceae bacterium]|nr:RNA polymerase sporulation sigma factor SigH [Oscillospiraceae bacterium]
MLNAEAEISDSLSDEELVEQFQCGDADSLNIIIERYSAFVRGYTKKYFLVGADQDDIMQEGMIGIYKAAKDYRPEKNSSFKTFAAMCVKRRIITAVKTALRQKHTPLNNYISLNRQVYDSKAETTLEDIISLSSPVNPETIFIDREDYAGMENKINKALSKLEFRVLSYYLEKRSYQEISVLINRDIKSVDNALQRIKKKIETLLKDMDN